MEDARQERPEAGVVLRLRGGQRDGAVRAAVERAEERDDVRAMGRVAGELDGGFDHLGAGVAEVGAGATLDRGELGEPAADLGVDRQVEVAGTEVDQLGGLLLDRGHDLRVRVARGVDRDAGGEVQEEVAVDVLDRQAVAPDRHDRVGTREARRRPGLIERDVGASLRPGQLRDDVRDGPTFGDPRRGRRQGTPQTAGIRASVHNGYALWISRGSIAERRAGLGSGRPGRGRARSERGAAWRRRRDVARCPPTERWRARGHSARRVRDVLIPPCAWLEQVGSRWAGGRRDSGLTVVPGH